MRALHDEFWMCSNAACRKIYWQARFLYAHVTGSCMGGVPPEHLLVQQYTIAADKASVQHGWQGSQYGNAIENLTRRVMGLGLAPQRRELSLA